MKMMTRMTKISKSSQKARFIKAAREAECSEDEAVFDRNMQKITKVNRTSPKLPTAKRRTAADNVD